MLTTKQSTAEAKMLVKCDLKMMKFSVIGGKKRNSVLLQLILRETLILVQDWPFYSVLACFNLVEKC